MHHFMLYLWVEPAALSEESASDEPETVADSELVLDDVVFRQTRMRIVPLVRTESCHDEEGEADQHIGREDVKPDFHGQGVHE